MQLSANASLIETLLFSLARPPLFPLSLAAPPVDRFNEIASKNLHLYPELLLARGAFVAPVWQESTRICFVFRGQRDAGQRERYFENVTPRESSLELLYVEALSCREIAGSRDLLRQPRTPFSPVLSTKPRRFAFRLLEYIFTSKPFARVSQLFVVPLLITFTHRTDNKHLHRRAQQKRRIRAKMGKLEADVARWKGKNSPDQERVEGSDVYRA